MTRLIVWALFLAAVAGLGCSAQQRRGLETSAAKAVISDEQEQQLGLQVKNELEQQQHVKYITDPAINSYVQSVVDRILPFAKKDRPDQKWELHVIDDLKTVNAFATPGGYIYVYSGILTEADNEAELAGVLSHESGHVVARHSARQMVDEYGLDAIVALAIGQNPGRELPAKRRRLRASAPATHPLEPRSAPHPLRGLDCASEEVTRARMSAGIVSHSDARSCRSRRRPCGVSARPAAA